jgi:hypothetical protein
VTFRYPVWQMKRSTRLLAGVAALLTAFGLCFVAVEYLFGGAGLQLTGFGISSTTVLVGSIHLVGFMFGAAVAFVLGLWWCADGLVSDQPDNRENVERQTREPRF